jgi:release factor glutamine methyltransferase
LRPSRLLAVEHDDTTSRQTAELVCGTTFFTDVEARRDLTGRPRFVTATRAGAGER